MPAHNITKRTEDLWAIDQRFSISKVVSHTLNKTQYFIFEWNGNCILSKPYDAFELALEAIETDNIQWERKPMTIQLTDTDMIREFKNACLKCEVDIYDGGRDLVDLGRYFKTRQSEYTMQLNGKVQNFEGKLLKNGEVIATYC